MKTWKKVLIGAGVVLVLLIVVAVVIHRATRASSSYRPVRRNGRICRQSSAPPGDQAQNVRQHRRQRFRKITRLYVKKVTGEEGSIAGATGERAVVGDVAATQASLELRERMRSR